MWVKSGKKECTLGMSMNLADPTVKVSINIGTGPDFPVILKEASLIMENSSTSTVMSTKAISINANPTARESGKNKTVLLMVNSNMVTSSTVL